MPVVASAALCFKTMAGEMTNFQLILNLFNSCCSSWMHISICSLMGFIPEYWNSWLMLLQALSIAFQCLWVAREVPVNWKLKNVVLIFRKSKEDPSNFSPVNLTSVLGEIVEDGLFWEFLKNAWQTMHSLPAWVCEGKALINQLNFLILQSYPSSWPREDSRCVRFYLSKVSDIVSNFPSGCVQHISRQVIIHWVVNWPGSKSYCEWAWWLFPRAQG